jgi:protein-arginine kinase activator protein McsA
MEIRTPQLTELVTGYVCDVCGRNCAKEPGEDRSYTDEHATLSGKWGFWSDDKDLTWHECHLCESCYDKVRRFIEEELKGTVRTGSVRG